MKMYANLVLISALALPGVAIAKNSDAISAAFSKSYQFEYAQNYNDAIKSLTAVLDSNPKEYSIHARLGWVYYLAGNYANSSKHYQTAVKLSPKAIEPKLGLMLTQLAQEKYRDAEQTGNQIVKTDTYNYLANLRLCYALKGQQKYDSALAIITKMNELYPTDVGLMVELGNLYSLTNNGNKATAVFKEVLILDPENYSAKQYLGISTVKS